MSRAGSIVPLLTSQVMRGQSDLCKPLQTFVKMLAGVVDSKMKPNLES